MIIHDVVQNSEDWHKLRLGRFTASVCADLLMDKKTKGYQNLINKVIEEMFTGEPCESKAWQGNSFTDRGHEYEPIAIRDFEQKYFCDVVPVGFISLNEWAGCSPDGLIDDNGLIQVKCPIFNTQREYIKSQKVPTNYYKQMQFELYVTGREYNIFYSYHPKLKEVCIKLERDEEMISLIKSTIEESKIIILNELKELKK